MSEKRTWKIKPLYRILAIVLVVIFFFASFVGTGIRVTIDSGSGSDTENAAADYLINNTDYINKNIFGRAGVFLKARLLSAEHFEGFYNMAGVAIAQGEYEKAAGYIDNCLKLYSGDDEVIIQDLLIKKGCLEAMTGEYESALICFDGLSEENYFRQDIGQIVVQLYIELDKLQTAETYLKNYIDEIPGDLVMTALYGQVLYSQERWEEAADVYTGLLAEEEDSAYLVMRGLCLEQSEKFEEAVSDFAKACEIGYDDPGMCYYHIALCSYVLGKNDEVLANCEAALEHESEQAAPGDIHYLMGLSYFQTEKYDLAIEKFTQAIDEDAEMKEVYYYRGVCLMVKGRYEEAEADYKASIENNIQVALSYYNSGLCNTQIGDYEQAISDFSKVSEYTTDENIIKSAEDFIELIG